MKAWFGCTTAEWETYRDNYFQIRDGMMHEGCVILHDWLPNADKIFRNKIPFTRSEKIYKSVLEAITQSDVVVIENTVPNFSTAHQITFAIQRQKPTLILRLHKDKTIFADSYIESLGSSHLTVKQYTPETLPAILKEFLRTNEAGNSQDRYNIVLNKKHKYYLDWAANNYKKSRSELLRKSLDKSISEDEEYRKYMGE